MDTLTTTSLVSFQVYKQTNINWFLILLFLCFCFLKKTIDQSKWQLKILPYEKILFKLSGKFSRIVCKLQVFVKVCKSKKCRKTHSFKSILFCKSCNNLTQMLFDESGTSVWNFFFFLQNHLCCFVSHFILYCGFIINPDKTFWPTNWRCKKHTGLK